MILNIYSLNYSFFYRTFKISGLPEGCFQSNSNCANHNQMPQELNSPRTSSDAKGRTREENPLNPRTRKDWKKNPQEFIIDVSKKSKLYFISNFIRKRRKRIPLNPLQQSIYRKESNRVLIEIGSKYGGRATASAFGLFRSEFEKNLDIDKSSAIAFFKETVALKGHNPDISYQWLLDQIELVKGYLENPQTYKPDRNNIPPLHR